VSASTTIEWTRGDDGSPGATWNPVTGCRKVSEGCDHCYAETFAERWRGIPGHPFEQGFDVRLWPDRLALPLRWKKPRRVFLNSMSDLWHDAVPADLIARTLAVVAVAEQHTFQVLTKRPGRMGALLADAGFWAAVDAAAAEQGPSAAARDAIRRRRLPNLWLGVSVELQKWAPVRLDKLLAAPGPALRFASCEPLLGPLDLTPWLGRGLDWVIAGGESGPRARPMHPDWARGLRDQCERAGTAFFFKQWGMYAPAEGYDGPARGRIQAVDRAGILRPDGVCAPAGAARMRRAGKAAAGRMLDGRTWDGFPAGRKAAHA
jgi:protein gp37